MLKLVALCAVFAVVAAEPTHLHYISPVATYSSVLSPASVTISQQPSSVIHPSPLVYSTRLSYTHLIKKRSAPALSYPISYIGAQTYAAPGTPLLTSTYTTPYITSAPLISQATFGVPTAHLIKKRSAPLLATTYYANGAYASPALSYSAGAFSTYPLTSPTLISHGSPAIHLIKKRSAPFLSTGYYATQPFGAVSTVPLTYSAPLISQPIASYTTLPATYTQLIKKRET